jgi:hypothetical protein
MKHSSFLLTLYLLLAVPTIVLCQKEQFNVGLVAGLNNTPVLYNQFGVNAGLIATTSINERHGFRLELLLTQNGDNSLFEDIPEDKTIYRVLYVETPIYFDWKWPILKKQQSLDLDAVYSLGLAYSRAVSVFAEDSNNNKEQINFSNKNSALFKSGLTFIVAKRFGLNINLALPIRKTEINPTYAIRLICLLKKS